MASNSSDAGKAASTSSTSKQPLKASSAGKTLETARKQNGSPVDTQNKKQNPPPAKAWQGPNPITSRSNTASPLTNGTTPKPSSRAGMDALTEKHAHDRMLFLLANMTGCDATLTLKNGEQFTGVFSGGVFEPASKAAYTLKMVKRVRLPSHQQANGVVDLPDEYTGEGEDHVASFDVQDTIDLAVNNVTLASKTTQNGSATSSFRTDTEISGRAPSMPRERELQRWEPGPADMSLDDMAIEESGTNGWDQFAANEQKYGVQTTYDEDIYTTAIDKSHPEYKKRAADAERLAREIEGSTASNPHIAEERRTDTHGADDGDEEDKYSGVRRDVAPLPKAGSGSYIPPSRRPITNAPTVPGAPFDPAIISSQVARPQHLAVDKSAEPKTEDIAEPAKIEKSPSPIPASKISPSTTEDRVRDSADAFKQFANNEKMRLRQAQEQKRTNARNEKNVRINDLKKFAENFKLKSRVPDDLISILAKDHEKQLEIKRKAEEAARTEEQRAKDPKASPSPSSTAAQTSERTSISSQSSKPRAAPNRSQLVPQLTPGMSRRQAEVFNTKPVQRAQQPVQTNISIPTGPAAQNTAALSPSAVKSLNVNAKAFEFRPVANNFTPTGVSPSPQRLPSVAPQQPSQTSFFSEEEKNKIAQRQDSEEHDTDVIAYLQSTVNEEQKKSLASTGGVPQPFRTNPTWTVPDNRKNTNYEDMFPKPHINRSPLHTPNGQMPHNHQLPPNMQPNMQAQRFYPQQGMPPYAQAYDPRFQPGGPGASVQSSPRIQQAQIPFGAQMGHMQQFPGQPMPVYSMSPSMSQRPLHMPHGGPMMMQQYPHAPGAQMRTHYGQYPQMMAPPGPNGFGQGYSPMPQHAAPHLQHMPMQQGFSASPRPAPHMMQHGGSHQGFQPHQMMFNPGQPSPYAMNQRQMSSGQYPQATPRQQQVLPAAQPLPSPGMNGPPPQQSDEGK